VKTGLRVLCPLLLILFIVTVPSAQGQNTVQTIAGGGPNNLPALKSSMGSPGAVDIDGVGNVYIADLYSERILRVDTTGNVTVFAGTGARGGSFGEGGPAISAWLIDPTGVAADSAGNIFIADRTYCTIRKVSAATGIISTVAGTGGDCRYSGDGGPATEAALNSPSGVAVDSVGNIYIADTNNCLIRAVSASNGVISTVAGTPPDITGLLHCGYSGDGGMASSAKLGFPNALVVDGSGNIIIADTTNCAIRKISASAGTISTVAGTGSCGYSGDGGAATRAQLGQVFGVAVDRSGNIFLADTVNCLVREVSAASDDISTVAGDYGLGCGYSGDGGMATSAQLNQPYDVAVDRSGDILIADYKNSAIREVSPKTGSISTFAGVAVTDPNHMGQMLGLPGYSGDGYLATDAEIGFLNASPWAASLAVDSSGNVFIADTANNAIRKVSASTGIMTTVAGDGLIGYSGDGGPATSAELFYPRGVAVDGSGNVFIVDSGNCTVRKISAATGIISTVAGTPPDNAGNYYCGFSGDGGPATSAELYPIDLLLPAGGVAVDSSGNIFIADTGNGVIREVSVSTGNITTVVGVGGLSFVGDSGDGGPATSALLNAPYAVAVDNAGNIYIADTGNYEVREVMAVNGNIYSVAGNATLGKGFSGDGGPADLAQLGSIFGLFLDPAGNLFIPDPDNCVIREVSGSTGIISTVAGAGNSTGDYYCGYSGDGGPALSAVFDSPSTAAADASGDLVVLDNVRVRSVSGLVQGSGPGAVAFPNPLAFTRVQLGTSNTLTVMLSNRGSSSTGVSTVAISGTNASDFSETDNCVGRSLGASGGSCAVSVKFIPSVTGTESALLAMTDTLGTQSVGLIGTVTDFSIGPAPGGSTTATVSAGSPATYNLQVTPISGFNGTVVLSCTGAPPESACIPEGSVTPANGDPATFSVQVTTTAPSIAPRPIGRQWHPFDRLRIFPIVLAIALATLLAFASGVQGAAAQRRRAYTFAMPLGFLLLAVTLSGCGGGGTSSTGPPPASGGTPTGNYTLTITGTSNGVSHSQTLNLTVD
jgi:sugar lactone lactonase YvrE